MIMRISVILVLVAASLCAHAQKAAIKTNLLYDATTTFNLGVEGRLGRRTTLDVSANYNPWTFSDNKKLKHVLVQPEVRHWFCETFNRGFLGFHALYSYYNIGGLDLPLNYWPKLKENRYEGWLLGAGLSYGYQWYLGRRWNLEATIGAGYVYLDYDRYQCATCGSKIESSYKHYVGPTKAGISLIYLLKDGKGKNRKEYGPGKARQK